MVMVSRARGIELTPTRPSLPFLHSLAGGFCRGLAIEDALGSATRCTVPRSSILPYTSCLGLDCSVFCASADCGSKGLVRELGSGQEFRSWSLEKLIQSLEPMNLSWMVDCLMQQRRKRSGRPRLLGCRAMKIWRTGGVSVHLLGSSTLLEFVACQLLKLPILFPDPCNT